MNILIDSIKKNTSATMYSNSYYTDDISQLSKIHNPEFNISIWRRSLEKKIIEESKYILDKNPQLRLSEVVTSENVIKMLKSELGFHKKTPNLFKDISDLVSMFCNLLNTKQVWLRFDAIDGPMCPRFHTDYVKCRLVTTYIGHGTQWLPNYIVNREKLGHGNENLPDEKSGLFQSNSDIEQLEVGHVALLKGDAWKGNNGLGLVHRSPSTDCCNKRLYMTIDFDSFYLSIHKKIIKKY